MKYQTNQLPQAPTILVIFGATGDLMTKKIAPALFELFAAGQLPELFTIIGSARRPLTHDQFQAHIREIMESHQPDKDQLDSFLKHVQYHQAEFSQAADYQSLAEEIGLIDQEWQACSNKLFYLAIPPHQYQLMFEQLAESGLTKACSAEEGWTRVIVEKPFGDDVQSAQELDQQLGALFQEEQIYRIDHYLAKEMLQNILIFRFANNLFEQVWNNQGLESIEMVLDEDFGVEKRGAFYDRVGALKDVGQNHLLQILALLTMQNPLSLDAEPVRQQRAAMLKHLPRMNPDDIAKQTFRAQHQGYRQIEGVSPDSEIETYFKIEFELDHPDWKGVPITIRSGKLAPSTHKEILITFKHPSPCLCPPDGHIRNYVSIRFDDQEQIGIQLWVKKPGYEFEIESKQISFEYESLPVSQYTAEYQQLLLDCIHEFRSLNHIAS